MLEPFLRGGKCVRGCRIQRWHTENLPLGLLGHGNEAATSSCDYQRHPLLCLRWAKSTLTMFFLLSELISFPQLHSETWLGKWISFYKKVFLPSVLAGHVILSAGKDGVVAVSSLADGTITRVIEDHRGAAVTAIHCVNEQVSPAIKKEESP